MAVIGTLGDIVFEVSSDKVRTFDELTHTAIGRWASHETIKSKPKAEFIGPGVNEMSFTIKLVAEFGVNPREEQEKIDKMILEGRHAPFILGNKPIGTGEWYIEESETTFIKVNSRSQVEVIEMVLALKEYF